MARRTKADAQATRSGLLDAAEQLFEARGVSRTSLNDIAGIVSAKGNVLGLMPHPENLIEAAHGGVDGRALFESALGIAA